MPFTTKLKLGRAMLARAHAAGVPFARVTADSVRGVDYALRRWRRDWSLGHVLAVTRAQRLGLSRVDELAAGMPADGRHRLSAGEGSKGPRLRDWTRATYASGAEAGWEKGPLLRRKPDQPGELAFYLTHAPEGTALADLVRVAGIRWTIESCFEAAKGEVGLDECEVRSWAGWCRHITLATLAHAYLALVRKVAVGTALTPEAPAEPAGRGFALALDRGGMRQVRPRGRENLRKRCPVHVAGHDLCPATRLPVGTVTSRELPVRASAHPPAFAPADDAVLALLAITTGTEAAPLAVSFEL